jgi:hypothetical protein
MEFTDRRIYNKLKKLLDNKYEMSNKKTTHLLIENIFIS